MDCKVEVLLWKMKGDDKSDQDGLKQKGSQHENTLWNVIGINKIILVWKGTECIET